MKTGWEADQMEETLKMTTVVLAIFTVILVTLLMRDPNHIDELLFLFVGGHP